MESQFSPPAKVHCITCSAVQVQMQMQMQCKLQLQCGAAATQGKKQLRLVLDGVRHVVCRLTQRVAGLSPPSADDQVGVRVVCAGPRLLGK